MTTHFRVCGEGEPLLLIHGLMTSSYSWRYNYAALGDHFRLYAPDLPGAGRSDKVTSASYDPRHLAEWVAEFQRTVGIRGCPVVGNSLGGYIGMWLALRDPKALSALVDVHSPGVPTLRLRALSTAGRIPGVEGLIAWLARRDPEVWAHEQVHYWDESLKSLEEARRFGEPLASESGSRTFAKYLVESLATDVMGEFVDRLERLRDEERGFPVPLFLLYADDDPVVPAHVGERLAELVPEARYERIEASSHFVQVDAPEAFLERTVDFLDA